MKKVNDTIFDLIIIGTGPAGLTASLYAERYRLKTLALGTFPGGTTNQAHKICNFPTEVEITGMELAEKMTKVALAQGVEIKNDEVVDIKREDGLFSIITDGYIYKTKTVILAKGMHHRKLGLTREKELLGRGVSYCATCDGMFFKDKVVGVVGGGDSALTAALYLADIADKVFLIYRGKELKGEPVWIEKVKSSEKIEILLETNIQDLLGEKQLESVYLDKPYGSSNELAIQGLFVEIGSEPRHAKYLHDLDIKLDENNFINVTPDQKTSAVGVWAAGDITNGSNGFRQIVTACSEGAVAAENVFRYLQKK
ncbi:MAG: FAD-dependent oxidoreductase [bacterium]